MLLAINCGFYNTKVKSLAGRFVHPTKIQENEGGTKTLILDGVTYEVGVGARDISEKQLNKAHEVCTNYSLLKHASADSVSLMVALPIGIYLNRDYRERYREKLLGTHTGIIDGHLKTAYVKTCTVIAEGAAAYLPYKTILKDKVVGILDFGGNTINCIIYDNGNLIKDTITQLDLGMIKLERNIIDEINSKTAWSVQEYEVKEIIENNECKEIVDRCIYNHIKEIKQRLRERKWNIDRLTIFATGGGSVQLKEYLEASFNRIIVSRYGLWDNVEGLWLAGEVIGE